MIFSKTINHEPLLSIYKISVLFGAFFASLGCGFLEFTDQTIIKTPQSINEPTLTPGITVTANDKVEPSPSLIPDTGWQAIRAGLERRVINWSDGDVSNERIYLLRIDPKLYRFDVAYKPGNPQSMTDWQQETGALIVVNGGFFTEADVATGLVIVDGQSFGTSYEGFGGMLAINNAGPELRWLPIQPYDPNEPFLAGLQSFPMLVTPDGVVGYPDDDGLRARRTVIAQDRNGHFVFALATTGTFTLSQMSRFLVETDLNIYSALNLDGGASTGILLAQPVEGVAPFSLLPAVITIYEK